MDTYLAVGAGTDSATAPLAKVDSLAYFGIATAIANFESNECAFSLWSPNAKYAVLGRDGIQEFGQISGHAPWIVAQLLASLFKAALVCSNSRK